MIYFQIIIGLLVVLAIIDLIVGVSNDAVNFLNSAVGSKVASFRTILLIASVGVLIGTLSSNGMMQIARNGIFQPEFFTFDKVIIIFLAVMLTDVILLDIYNSLGLPTSTTVSLIFELLGASFTVGILYVIEQHKPFSELETVLNYKSAIVIIGGIFFSVFVAFISGTFIHFFSRLLFTFKLKRTLQVFGPAFTAIAVTIMIYFLLIKGLEGTSLISANQLHWIQQNTTYLLGATLVITFLATLGLMRFSKVNPLKIIVLIGTFSLAMAFAGNDLVNFIGVSVAAYSAYQAWAISGIAADAFSMNALNEQIVTPTWFLLLSGAIMVATLWLSAKSKKVTETEVSLGRQDEGEEKFTTNPFARLLVGGAIFVGSRFTKTIPDSWLQKMEKRLRQPKGSKKAKADEPSFDLLRAAVNLVVASALIAYGTSQKLPLSTTFVSFMVAMGASFADQAWGRESAVYRVSGVLQVIGGWVLTAFVAFAGSSVIALILYFTGFIGVVVIATITFALLLYSQITFKRAQRNEAKADKLLLKETITVRELLEQSKLNADENILGIQRLLQSCWDALLSESPKKLLAQKKEVKKVAAENKRISEKIIRYIRKTEQGGLQAGRLNMLVFDILQDLYQSSILIGDSCSEHVANFHPTPGKDFQKKLEQIEVLSNGYFSIVHTEISQLNFHQSEEEEKAFRAFINFLASSLDSEILRIQQNEINSRLATLQTRILLEMKDIIESTHQLYILHKDFLSAR
ncbi:MAG: inorganic phosphate transporter [Cyclobacteriaceae bacterium]|nr:inorganic phosphate transporter [Cyclobacteriaceae bacterium]